MLYLLLYVLLDLLLYKVYMQTAAGDMTEALRALASQVQVKQQVKASK